MYLDEARVDGEAKADCVDEKCQYHRCQSLGTRKAQDAVQEMLLAARAGSGTGSRKTHARRVKSY